MPHQDACPGLAIMLERGSPHDTNSKSWPTRLGWSSIRAYSPLMTVLVIACRGRSRPRVPKLRPSSIWFYIKVQTTAHAVTRIVLAPSGGSVPHQSLALDLRYLIAAESLRRPRPKVLPSAQERAHL